MANPITDTLLHAANAKIFDITTPKRAAIYGGSGALIFNVTLVASATLGTIASLALAGDFLNGLRISNLNPEIFLLSAYTTCLTGLAVGTTVGLPFALAAKVAGGQYLANRFGNDEGPLNEQTKLNYRTIAKLEATRICEAFAFGI